MTPLLLTDTVTQLLLQRWDNQSGTLVWKSNMTITPLPCQFDKDSIGDCELQVAVAKLF